MAQGFIQVLNLRESNTLAKDTSAINNLGGTGIANDLRLFSNNVLNETVIEASTFTVDVDKYVIVDTNVYQIVFSNRTKVTHNGSNLTVVNSNGFDRFRLENDSGTLITPNPSFDIVRSDIVRLDNIKNLITSSPSTDQSSTALSDEEDNSVSESSIAIVGDTNVRLTLEELFQRNEESIDKYRFDRTFSIVTDTPISFNSRVRYRSTISITNDEAVSLPTSPGVTDNAPGIFIATDTDSQRAFSNNNNPWSGTVLGSGYLLTSASQASVATLLLTDPDFESLSTDTILPSNAGQDYTHKIEVSVNGETYYLLCSEN